MRPILTETTDRLIPPTAEARAEAARGGDLARHAHYLADWPAMRQIEHAPAPLALPHPDTLTVAAWNIERCKRVEDSATLLRDVGADIVLATEMDLGMARSGQRHTTRDLAAALGFGYVFGVEFTELGTGDAYETSLFESTPNAAGLHGNAILSRYPLARPAILPVAEEGHWFAKSPKGDGQYRVGGRMAIAAQIVTAKGALTLAAVHYESESDAAGRADQTAAMLEGLRAIYGSGPCVLGGDLNTAALAGLPRATVLTLPQAQEPGFDHLARAGFDWRTANTGAPTTRAAPGRPVRYPLRTLDWLFTRACHAQGARVHAAVSETGDYLSDHELITARITL